MDSIIVIDYRGRDKESDRNLSLSLLAKVFETPILEQSAQLICPSWSPMNSLQNPEEAPLAHYSRPDKNVCVCVCFMCMHENFDGNTFFSVDAQKV